MFLRTALILLVGSHLAAGSLEPKFTKDSLGVSLYKNGKPYFAFSSESSDSGEHSRYVLPSEDYRHFLTVDLTQAPGPGHRPKADLCLLDTDGNTLFSKSGYDAAPSLFFMATDEEGRPYSRFLAEDASSIICFASAQGDSGTAGTETPKLVVLGRDGKELFKREGEAAGVRTDDKVYLSRNGRYLGYWRAEGGETQLFAVNLRSGKSVLLPASTKVTEGHTVEELDEISDDGQWVGSFPLDGQDGKVFKDSSDQVITRKITLKLFSR